MGEVALVWARFAPALPRPALLGSAVSWPSLKSRKLTMYQAMPTNELSSVLDKHLQCYLPKQAELLIHICSKR